MRNMMADQLFRFLQKLRVSSEFKQALEGGHQNNADGE